MSAPAEMNNYNKYFYITETEERWGFYVNTAGYSKINPNSDYPLLTEHPHSHTFDWNKGRILTDYYLVFISKGQGVFESAITPPAQINEGAFFFLYPGVWHRYKPDLTLGWEEYWIGFNGTYPNELMHKGFFTAKKPLLNVGVSSELLSLFQSLIETIQTSSDGYQQVVTGIVLQILGVANTFSEDQGVENDPAERLMSKAKSLLQETLDKPADMELLAKELHMSYAAFRKTFKKKVGVSPNQYHLNLRLNKAMRLLSSTDLTIGEVAYQTGFQSLFYFSKLFKKRIGESPKLYRKNNVHFN
ncbi:MAG: AraC family transcriptional regulator [Ginsengibacter sp.]